VYDMYEWNQPPADRGPADRGPAGRSARPGSGRRAARLPRTARPDPAAPATAPATQALQVALDRRDNGGPSAAVAAQ
jgi:hypothetical protein